MLDLCIIIIISIFGIIGYKRGFIKSALTLGSSIIALILSFIAYPIMEMLLRVSPIYAWIYQIVDHKMGNITFSGGLQSQGDIITKSITWIPSILVEQIRKNNNTAMYDLLGATNVKEYICLYIAKLLIGLFALFLTWLFLKIILDIGIKFIVGVVEYIPIISGLNRYGGLCIGILKAGIILSVIGLIIPILTEIPIIKDIYSAIQMSYIGKWLYESNLIIVMYNYLFL